MIYQIFGFPFLLKNEVLVSTFIFLNSKSNETVKRESVVNSVSINNNISEGIENVDQSGGGNGNGSGSGNSGNNGTVLIPIKPPKPPVIIN